MIVDLRMSGFETLQRELNELLAAAHTSVERTSNFVVQSTAQRAKAKIRLSAPTGRGYFRENPDRFVIASSPGQAPANDLGILARGITFTKFASGRANVMSTAPYSFDLEFGTDSIAARPFLYPSFREAIEQAAKKLRIEFESLL